MGLSIFARRQAEKRVELAGMAALYLCGIAAFLLAYFWWSGRVGSLASLLLILYIGLLAALGMATRQGNVIAAGALTLLVGAATLVSFVQRPFQLDLLGWLALFFLVRGFLAARKLKAAAETEGGR